MSDPETDDDICYRLPVHEENHLSTVDFKCTEMNKERPIPGAFTELKLLSQYWDFDDMWSSDSVQDTYIPGSQDTSPNKDTTLPGKSDDSVPANLEILIPQNSDIVLPKESTSLMRENPDILISETVEYSLPKKLSNSIPEKLDIFIPETLSNSIPKKSSTSMPEKLDTFIPETFKPKETETFTPEKTDISVQEQTDNILPGQSDPSLKQEQTDNPLREESDTYTPEKLNNKSQKDLDIISDTLPEKSDCLMIPDNGPPQTEITGTTELWSLYGGINREDILLRHRECLPKDGVQTDERASRSVHNDDVIANSLLRQRSFNDTPSRAPSKRCSYVMQHINSPNNEEYIEGTENIDTNDDEAGFSENTDRRKGNHRDRWLTNETSVLIEVFKNMLPCDENKSKKIFWMKVMLAFESTCRQRQVRISKKATRKRVQDRLWYLKAKFQEVHDNDKYMTFVEKCFAFKHYREMADLVWTTPSKDVAYLKSNQNSIDISDSEDESTFNSHTQTDITASRFSRHGKDSTPLRSHSEYEAYMKILNSVPTDFLRSYLSQKINEEKKSGNDLRIDQETREKPSATPIKNGSSSSSKDVQQPNNVHFLMQKRNSQSQAPTQRKERIDRSLGPPPEKRQYLPHQSNQETDYLSNPSVVITPQRNIASQSTLVPSGFIPSDDDTGHEFASQPASSFQQQCYRFLPENLRFVPHVSSREGRSGTGPRVARASQRPSSMERALVPPIPHSSSATQPIDLSEPPLDRIKARRIRWSDDETKVLLDVYKTFRDDFESSADEAAKKKYWDQMLKVFQKRCQLQQVGTEKNGKQLFSKMDYLISKFKDIHKNATSPNDPRVLSFKWYRPMEAIFSQSSRSRMAELEEELSDDDEEDDEDIAPFGCRPTSSLEQLNHLRSLLLEQSKQNVEHNDFFKECGREEKMLMAELSKVDVEADRIVNELVTLLE